MNKELKTILAELRRYLSELYGERLVDVVLFGSQAPVEAVDGSDIDLLIVLKGNVYPGSEIDRTGDFVAALSLEHDVLLGRFRAG
jgi:predicted nucleotidyltransferase